MPDVEGGILLPEKSTHSVNAGRNFRRGGCAWVLSTGLEARLYGRQWCPPLRAWM